MALSKTLQEKLKRLDDVPDNFSSSIISYEKSLLIEILDLVDILERDSKGFIKLHKRNLGKIDKIVSNLKAFMFQGEYADLVRGFASEFNIQRDLNAKYFKETFDSFTPDDIYNEAYKISKKTSVELLKSGAINKEFIIPITAKFEEGITGKMKYKDFKRSLREFVLGEEQLEGKLARYIKQVSKDSFSIVDRTYTQTISSDLNIQFYQYVGGLIKDSRCFCIDRANKFFSKTEIEQFGDKLNLGECRQESRGIVRWQGMTRGTNSATIFNFAGGYNCNHVWSPVSVFSVPKEVLQRNIEAGHYKPSEKERNLLGI